MIVFCVILTLVCSLRACHMWLTRNQMFIRKIWGKFTSFIVLNFEISLVSLGRFQYFKKVNLVNLSQNSLLNMWLLVQIVKSYESDNNCNCNKCNCNIPHIVTQHTLAKGKHCSANHSLKLISKLCTVK